MSSTFLNGLSMFIDAVKDSNSTDYECRTSIDHYLFYQFCLIPATVLVLLMAATKPRRHKLLSFLKGRPGLIFPMDALTRSSRISYCAAFGATGFTVYQIVWNRTYAIDYSDPFALKTLIVLVSVFIYGMVFFPVFTSLALGTAFSYLLGSLYVWMYFSIEVYKLTECNFNAAGRAILLLRGLPNLLCLAYLTVALPIKCVVAVRKKRFLTPSLGEDAYNETLEQIKESYQGKHVIKLLQKPEVVTPQEGLINTIKSGISGILGAWIYHKQDGFRYPSRMISVMFIAGSLIYVLTVELLVNVISLFDTTLQSLQSTLKSLHAGDASYDAIKMYIYFTQVFGSSLIVSLSVTSAMTFINILHMISSFRTNLFAMYRGDYSHIPSPTKKGAITLCTGSIKYAGFQVAYIVSAFVIISTVLFIICMLLAIAITLLIHGYNEWLLKRLRNFWPGLLFTIALFVIQKLLAKFVFLQDRGQHLRLDNRRFYFVFVYFMFFYNIFLGLFSCLLRIIKALGVGLLFLGRLDNSTLPRKFEFFDPGFSAYQGYIHMEAAHTHPVVNVFIRLLVALSNARKTDGVDSKGIEMSSVKITVDTDEVVKESNVDNELQKPVNVAARFNWFVLYTLLQNPAVRIYRKGFIQSIKKARLEGLKIPISDKPITDFDLVKAQQERDKLKELEAIKNSPSHGLYNGLAAMGSVMGGTRPAAVLNTQQKKKTMKKPGKKQFTRLFRKWGKRRGSKNLAQVDNNSQGCLVDHYNIETYVKHENV